MSEEPKVTRTIRSEFIAPTLTEEGIFKALKLSADYSDFLSAMEELCGGRDAPQMDFVRTKIQESFFYARRALAISEARKKEEGIETARLDATANETRQIAEDATAEG